VPAHAPTSAAEQGVPFEARPATTTCTRLNMGVFPQGAQIIPNPYNKDRRDFSVRDVHFVPGFPVIRPWHRTSMIEWVLDHHYAGCTARTRAGEVRDRVRGDWRPR